MRGNRRFLGWGFVLLAAGCGKPPTEAVYVDLDGVVAREPSRSPTNVAVPKPPVAMVPTSIVIPARAAESVRDPSTASDADVRRAMIAQQEIDYGRLVTRLRDFYEADALRFEEEQLRIQGALSDDAYAEANKRIRPIFEAYGQARAPLLARLTLLTSFPDPNPTSKPPRTTLTKVRQERFDEAKSLREQLAKLRADYDAKVAAQLGTVAGDVAKALADAQSRIQRYRTANDLRAEREASLQVPRSTRELGLRLTDPVHPALPAVASRTVTVPGAPAPPAAPVVSSTGVLATVEGRKMLAERQLVIWLGQHRYTLAKSSAGVRDTTRDFETWRNRRSVGR